MNIVEKLTEDTTCDACNCLIEAGELFVTGYVEVPFAGDGGTDMVPVIAMCAHCGEIPNGFQPGWDLYNVSESDLLEFADESIQEAAECGAAEPDILSAIKTIESATNYLQSRIDERQGQLRSAA